MTNYKTEVKMSTIKYSILEFFNKNKIRIIVLLILSALSLLTGVFTAFKINEMKDYIDFNDFSFITIIEGSIYTFTFFIKRYLSVFLVLFLLILLSINKYISLLGYFLISYRAYLLALNCMFIVIYMGFGGALNVLIVILPCQIIQLMLMIFMFVYSRKFFNEKCNYNTLNSKFLNIILCVLGLELLVNMIEFLLLLILKATTILII